MRSLLPERLSARFIAALLVFILFVLLTFRDDVMGAALVSLRVLTARTILALIQSAGMEAVREASAIYHQGGFAYEISRGCMGLVPAALFGASVLAYPSAARHKLVGLAVGIPLLLALNLGRLLHLFYLGVYQPDLFHFAHQFLWQAVIVAAVVAAWLLWAKWVDMPRGADSHGARNGRH